jgi:GDP-L-fucose synthase
MKQFYKNKKILVTGGTGLIGRQLVNILLSYDARLTVVSLDVPHDLDRRIKFIKKDLRDFNNCLKICKNIDYVFHLAGVKGSPNMTMKKPASFMTPTLMFSINMMEAARRQKVKRYLFTSSIGVYSPSKSLVEEDVWKTFPSKKDYIPGWTKRICELQADAYRIEYNFNNVSIVRPANVYGPFDNFDEANAMVIPSLISRALKSKKYLKVWGDGSSIRDFIYSADVAKGMALTLYKGIKYPINLGSGKGVSIRTIAEIIAKSVPNGPLKILWDKFKPSGDKIRLMNVNKANKMGFRANVDIVKGIKSTIDWYVNSKQYKKYNAFTEKF